MILKENSTDQKLRGAYYTPTLLAKKITEYFKDDAKLKTILEPSCGDGVFIDALLQEKFMKGIRKIVGIEIERSETEKLCKKFSDHKNICILNADFFDFYKQKHKQNKYDLVLGNPPYIRYQYLTESQREEMSEILKSHGMKSNKLINAWVGFIVACIHLLSENGKIAFVVPAEILQVAYAEDLRSFLSKELSNITILAFKNLVFPNIEQEIVVFIGEKTSAQKGIRIVELTDLQDLDIAAVKKNEFQQFSNMQEKWTKYFTSKKETDVIVAVRNDPRFQRLSDCALINVGITTGNNKYFSIDKKTVKEYDLESISLPLVGRSSHTNSVYFNKSDWQKNATEGKNAYLVNFPKVPADLYSEKQKAYIQLGEEKKCNIGYKCSIRECWYHIPSVWISEAFFLRRSNLYPKFVLNCCNAVSTDTMHRIKFYDGFEPERIVLSYYNSISFAFTEICGRSYGGGVLEILPGETGNICLPKLDFIPIETVRTLLKDVDRIIRENENIEKALDLTDKKILVELLGFDRSLCENARLIWKKLQKRRLERGRK